MSLIVLTLFVWFCCAQTLDNPDSVLSSSVAREFDMRSRREVEKVTISKKKLSLSENEILNRIARECRAPDAVEEETEKPVDMKLFLRASRLKRPVSPLALMLRRRLASSVRKRAKVLKNEDNNKNCDIGFLLEALEPEGASQQFNVLQRRIEELEKKMAQCPKLTIQNANAHPLTHHLCVWKHQREHDVLLDKQSRIIQSVAKLRKTRKNWIDKTGRSSLRFHNKSIKLSLWWNSKRERQFLKRVRCETRSCEDGVKDYIASLKRLEAATEPRPKLVTGKHFRRLDREGMIEDWDGMVSQMTDRVVVRMKGKWVERSAPEKQSLLEKGASVVQKAKQSVVDCGWNSECVSRRKHNTYSALAQYYPRLPLEELKKQFNEAVAKFSVCMFDCFFPQFDVRHSGSFLVHRLLVQYRKLNSLLNYCETETCLKEIRGRLNATADEAKRTMTVYSNQLAPVVERGVIVIGIVFGCVLALLAIAAIISGLLWKVAYHNKRFVLVLVFIAAANVIRIADYGQGSRAVSFEFSDTTLQAMLVSAVLGIWVTLFFTLSVLLFLYLWVIAIHSEEMIGTPFKHFFVFVRIVAIVGACSLVIICSIITGMMFVDGSIFRPKTDFRSFINTQGAAQFSDLYYINFFAVTETVLALCVVQFVATLVLIAYCIAGLVIVKRDKPQNWEVFKAPMIRLLVGFIIISFFFALRICFWVMDLEWTGVAVPRPYQIAFSSIVPEGVVSVILVFLIFYSWIMGRMKNKRMKHGRESGRESGREMSMIESSEGDDDDSMLYGRLREPILQNSPSLKRYSDF